MVAGRADGAVTVLVGRDDELALVVRHLRSLRPADVTGFVTITGLPGVGRSAVAAVATAELSSSGTAVLVVALDGADDPLALADAVLARLPGEGLSTSLPEVMWEAYDGAPVYVVLEDVDRVQGLAGVIEELMTGYPAATVVCTALRPLHVNGERVVRLASLPLPEDDAPAEHPALVLLAQRAGAGGVDVDLTDARQRADLARICRHAGGLPGSIELAAARMNAVPASLMARMLGVRHGVDAALEWSYELLSKQAQHTLVQLSVFEGPFHLDAVAAVVDVGPTSGDVTDDLLELVDAHLLELDPAVEGEPRFVVTEFVRRFARRRLDADGRSEATQDRHALYFHDRCRAGAEVVRREWPDIAAALDHEMANGRLDDALASVVALAPEVQDVPGVVASLEKRITELLARDEHVPDRLRAQALMWSTTAFPDGTSMDMQRVGLWTAQRLAQATALARASGDGPALLGALERTIRSLRITLDLAAAMSAAYEGLELARRLDDQRALARFECYVSMAARSNGDAERSVHLATSALTRGREHDDPVAVTSAAQLLLTLPEELRPRLDPPLPDLEQLLEQCFQMEQPFTAMTVLGALAHESLLRDDPSKAARWLWRLLMIGANRHRTEPMATLGGVALLLSVALALGEQDDAAGLRESTRPLELFLPYCIGPEALPVYQRDAALLDSSVSESRRLALAAEVNVLSMEQTNRWAQEVARRLAGHHPPAPRTAAVAAPALTPREHEVLTAMASGCTNREIADVLGMSAKTVMHHSVAIYRKLGVKGRSGATVWAFRHDLVS